ncbi:MAG: HK97 gp10 family phage protein [Alteromonadaceae bacterium]|nr:HK97 gp10 family phage protein [Alteromonadaceae bacterium]
MIKCEFEGGRELEAALKNLKRATAKNIARKALRRAAVMLAGRFKAGVRRVSGRLIESIGVGGRLNKRQKRMARGSARSDVEIYAGVTDDPAGAMLEFGTSRQAAKPFMRPVWQNSQSEVLGMIRDDMSVAVEKAIARDRRRAEREAAKMGQ